MNNTNSGHSGSSSAVTFKRVPIGVSVSDRAFGGRVGEILPAWKDIPDEFKHDNNPWVRWQQGWFFSGLTRYPVAKEGIDLKLAMDNLACVQGSFSPKHEHKQAGVAYLASLWFSSPDGEPIKQREKSK